MNDSDIRCGSGSLRCGHRWSRRCHDGAWTEAIGHRNRAPRQRTQGSSKRQGATGVRDRGSGDRGGGVGCRRGVRDRGGRSGWIGCRRGVRNRGGRSGWIGCRRGVRNRGGRNGCGRHRVPDREAGFGNGRDRARHRQARISGAQRRFRNGIGSPLCVPGWEVCGREVPGWKSGGDRCRGSPQFVGRGSADGRGNIARAVRHCSRTGRVVGGGSCRGERQPGHSCYAGDGQAAEGVPGASSARPEWSWVHALTPFPGSTNAYRVSPLTAKSPECTENRRIETQETFSGRRSGSSHPAARGRRRTAAWC
jgi:hypothetical protein